MCEKSEGEHDGVMGSIKGAERISKEPRKCSDHNPRRVDHVVYAPISIQTVDHRQDEMPQLGALQKRIACIFQSLIHLHISREDLTLKEHLRSAIEDLAR